MTYGRSRKVPFNCYLSVDQLDALDAVSEREGRPRAELVREALTEYLTHLESPDTDLREGDSATHRNSVSSQHSKPQEPPVDEASDRPQERKRRRTVR